MRFRRRTFEPSHIAGRPLDARQCVNSNCQSRGILTSPFARQLLCFQPADSKNEVYFSCDR
jgi:hypothetical protein